MKRMLVGQLALIAAFILSPAVASQPEHLRVMWVWKTDGVMKDHGERERFLEAAKALELTDAYLFLRTADYTQNEAQLISLLADMEEVGLRAWGMEGWRGYFSDAEGPAGLYAAADAMIDFNERNEVKFAGFHSDMEPQDGQGDGDDLFVNEIAQSELTVDQLVKRDRILSEWLDIHESLLEKTRAAGIQYGGAMPSWVDDYYGEPVLAVHDGTRKPVIEHLMALVPQYVIMSYNTNPDNVINRITGELEYAGAIGARNVLFALEVHPGAGETVSYADTRPKNRRSVVLDDIEAIEARVSSSPSYLGWGIHDWEGWAQLPP